MFIHCYARDFVFELGACQSPDVVLYICSQKGVNSTLIPVVTALLVYKLLHSGYPKYFSPFLKPRQSVFNTRKSQADGVFLEVPHFATSIYKSSKHFGLSFAYDAPKNGNDLSDDVCSVTSPHSFRRKLKTYLFVQAYPP